MKVKVSKVEGKSLIWKEIISGINTGRRRKKGRHLYKLQSVVGGEGCYSGIRIGHSNLNTVNIIGKHATGL